MVNNLQIAFDKASKKYFDQSSSDEEQVLLEYPPVEMINTSNKGKRKSEDNSSEPIATKNNNKSKNTVSNNQKEKKNVKKEVEKAKKHKSANIKIENTGKTVKKKKDNDSVVVTTKTETIKEHVSEAKNNKTRESKVKVNKKKRKIINNLIDKEKEKEVKTNKKLKNKIKSKDKSEKIEKSLPKSLNKKAKIVSKELNDTKPVESKSKNNTLSSSISEDFDSSSDESIKDLINESFSKISHKKIKKNEKKLSKEMKKSADKTSKQIKKKTLQTINKLTLGCMLDDYDILSDSKEKSPTFPSLGSHSNDASSLSGSMKKSSSVGLEIKDKFDLIKERRNPEKKPAENLLKPKNNIKTPKITKSKEKEKITKKAKRLLNELFDDVKKQDDVVKKEPKVSVDKPKAQNVSAISAETKKNIKQKATLDVLDLETEQTLKDINKWLEHTPRFEYNSESNSPSRYTIDDVDVNLKVVDNNDFRKPTPLPLSPSTSKKPFQSVPKIENITKEPDSQTTALTVDAALNKNPKKLPKKKMLLGDKHQIIFKKKEIQRTTNRLQPGKTKGNLLCNMQSGNKPDEAFPLPNKEKIKEIKNSLTSEASENSPKLNLGKVLDSSAFNFSNSGGNGGVIEKEEHEDISGTVTDEGFNDDSGLTLKEPSKIKSPESDQSDTVKKESAESSATPSASDSSSVKPNLSAWFKAFGVSKKPNNVEIKKTPSESKNENYSSSCSMQRRLSTGSSVSEISSVESSPHHMSLEDRAAPAPYPSPMNQSPVQSAISPKIDDVQKPYLDNGPIRVGFYQDTVSTKSSPEKSCSPHESLSSSPYQNYSQQTNVFPPQNVNNLNIYSNFYNPESSAKLRQSPTPLYDQYNKQQPHFNQEQNINKTMNAIASPSSSHHSQQSSPYQQPTSPYPATSDNMTSEIHTNNSSNASNIRSPSSSYSQSNSPFHQNPSSPYNNNNSNSQISPQIPTNQNFSSNQQLTHQSNILFDQHEVSQFSPNHHIVDASQKPLLTNDSCKSNNESNVAASFPPQIHPTSASSNNPVAMQQHHPSFIHATQSNESSALSAQTHNQQQQQLQFSINDPMRNKGFDKKLDVQSRSESEINYHDDLRRQQLQQQQQQQAAALVAAAEERQQENPKYLDLSKQPNRYPNQYPQLPVNFSQPLDLDFSKNRTFDTIPRNIPKNNYPSNCSLADDNIGNQKVATAYSASNSSQQLDVIGRDVTKSSLNNFIQNPSVNQINDLMTSQQAHRASQPTVADMNYKQSALFNATPASSMMELTAFMRDFRQSDDRFTGMTNPSTNYYEKNTQAATHMFAKNAAQSGTTGNFQQIFSNPMTTIAYGREQQDFTSYQSRLNIFQTSNNANQMINSQPQAAPVAPIVTPASKAKKPKNTKKNNAPVETTPVPQVSTTSISQHQMQPNQQQAHHIVPGSAFNYGPPTLPLYSENTASYLEEFRGAQNPYYSTALRTSAETIDKAAAVPNPPQAHPTTPSPSPYHHLIPSHHPSRSYPFMNSLDQAALQQQYRMMFNQSYQAGYHLGMHHNQPPPPHWYNP